MWIPPENVEGLIEQWAVLDSTGEACLEYVVQLTPPAYAGELERLQREQSPVGAHGQPCLAQHPGEVHDVVRELAGPGELRCRLGQHVSPARRPPSRRRSARAAWRPRSLAPGRGRPGISTALRGCHRWSAGRAWSDRGQAVSGPIRSFPRGRGACRDRGCAGRGRKLRSAPPELPACAAPGGG